MKFVYLLVRRAFPAIFGGLLLAAAVGAQTSVFNYQGRLTDNNAAANGNYDMQFALFDAASGGNQIGSTVTNTSVAVANGVFNVNIDFGANAFSGANRFLEISLRQTGNPNPRTVISPRQQLVSAPYSIRSLNAANADASTNAAQLGGVAANQYVLTTDSRLSNARTPTPGSTSYIQNTTTPQTASNFSIDGTGRIGSNLVVNGQVGIGTATPTEKLQVAGVIQSTTGGFKFPDGTMQTSAATTTAINRVVRGVIIFSGTNFQLSQTFTPAIDPTKSVVYLSGAVANYGSGGGNCVPTISRDAVLIALDTTSITVAVEKWASCESSLVPLRVSYQIVEYK